MNRSISFELVRISRGNEHEETVNSVHDMLGRRETTRHRRF